MGNLNSDFPTGGKRIDHFLRRNPLRGGLDVQLDQLFQRTAGNGEIAGIGIRQVHRQILARMKRQLPAAGQLKFYTIYIVVDGANVHHLCQELAGLIFSGCHNGVYLQLKVTERKGATHHQAPGDRNCMLITGIQGLATDQACLAKFAHPIATSGRNCHAGPSGCRQ